MQKTYLILLSLLAAVLLSLAWPAGGFPGLLFIGLVPLLWLEDHIAESRQRFHGYSVFLLSWLAFFIFNLLTTWWIKNSTLFGAVMAVVLNSMLMALTFHVYHLSKRAIFGPGRGHILLVFYWMSWEYFHLDWDLSWSWLNLGNGFASVPSWVQWYEYTGAFGGTLWVILVNILVYRSIRETRLHGFRVPRAWIMGLMALLLVALPLVWSVWRYTTWTDEGTPVDVVVTQPNIDPYVEQYEIPLEESVFRNLKLGNTMMDSAVDYLVGPESSLQENLWEGEIGRSMSERLIRQYMEGYPRLKVVIGASSFTRFPDGAKPSPTARWHEAQKFWFDAHNTALYFEHGREAETYHKSVLVPGVEKMPFRKYLSFMENLAIDLGGTVGSIAPSPERTVIVPNDGSPRIATAICYESAYGEFFSRFVRNGAELMFIITNDGWWGNTAGHKQHLSFASLRAIENRRCIARSANTGISAFINQRGDILQPTKYWEPAVIRGTLLARSKPTYYTVQGDYLARIAAFVTAFMLLISIVQAILKRK
ncbi:MAG: apolipoprotein N-acyltransferase [Bacteroidales bacterium]|nr:apolipoprotein N-acyltransferase [Bacteroidales bacterium]